MQQCMILLVEDNPDDEALALRALKKANPKTQVVVARDGQQALDFVFGEGDYQGRNVAEQPVVIFLDMKLPKLNGLDVLRNIRNDQRTCLLPVVILTSSDESSDIKEAYRLGANSYINKPVNFTEFSRQMNLMGEYWLDINRPPLCKLQ
ncbi:response regulator [Hahella aquimaris]|uniref:FOG: CheY-like receiver n=2 Tax=Hahella TaxID=158481 RepID=Q2SJ15_HAHCH|nr:MULTISPECIES: response regulator [Hahella]ABC29359.1 FOG: CheY-like receiver [Hahella chejuensis KCTC 2396]MBU6950917.1 response regulator [Hahella sp. HN01]MDG9671864.1 response regulator [Hahella sp. CR1]WLQ15599.1 response regulator [Hahella sp. HNIBRBA332]